MWAVFFICLVIYFFICEKIRKPLHYPPGPSQLPILGNFLSVWFCLRSLKVHHKVWQAWSQRYGDLLGLRLGPINIVVVSGRDRIKEVCSREVFDGRPSGFFYMLRSFGQKLGIVFSDGPSWTRTRRVVLKSLKISGYGTRSMEVIIGEECRALVKLRMAEADKPVVVNGMFGVSIVNIIWRMVAGKRYDLKDPRLTMLCDLITRSFKVVDMSGGILNCLPFLRFFVPGLIGYTELQDIYRTLYGFLQDTVKEHRENIDMKKPKDFIDILLIEMMEQKENAFTEEELEVVCLDLFQAGVETVGNTIEFMLLHIVRDSHVQNLLHEEIDLNIGKAVPTMADRAKMIYTEAVILESLRISSVAAVGIPHMALDDAQLGNYRIPKGTLLLLSMHDLHNCSHWKEPHNFKPERFITKEGNLMQDDWLMPFGTGRRRCIGESLARSELFMFLTHLLQIFRLKIPKGDPLPSTEPVNGVSLSAKPFRLIFEPRA